MFTVVYCRDIKVEKTKLWDKLEMCRAKWGGRWIIGSDFNLTLKREERNGNNFSVADAPEFKEVLDEVGMVDLPISKGHWTWSNKKSKLRIDRFLMSSNFLLELTNVSQKTLA